MVVGPSLASLPEGPDDGEHPASAIGTRSAALKKAAVRFVVFNVSAFLTVLIADEEDRRSSDADG
jgi:hypothetical protein